MNAKSRIKNTPVVGRRQDELNAIADRAISMDGLEYAQDIESICYLVELACTPESQLSADLEIRIQPVFQDERVDFNETGDVVVAFEDSIELTQLPEANIRSSAVIQLIQVSNPRANPGIVDAFELLSAVAAVSSELEIEADEDDIVFTIEIGPFSGQCRVPKQQLHRIFDVAESTGEDLSEDLACAG